MAAREGLNKIVLAALDEGADVEARDGYDYNALAYAVRFGHYRTVEILVALGADPPALIEKGATFLILSALEGSADIGEYLISLGVPIDVVDGDGDSAMSVAKKLGHEEFVAMLLKHKK
jgi:hypothetical protein